MRFIDDKIRVICEELALHMKKKLFDITDLLYQPTGYKEGDALPTGEGMDPFDTHLTIGGRDAHYWFKFHFKTPEKKEGHEVYFSLTTGREGMWDASNPQAILYLNGKMIQGMDVNHTEVLVDYDTEYDAVVYFYVGMHDDLVAFRPAVVEIDKEVEALYYDMKVPLDAAMVLSPKSNDYVQILKRLETAEGFLDMRNPGSDAYYAGVKDAREYLKKELYEGICGKHEAVVSCIGHTHIDVAWLWTLAQTREKAQRSFSTVIELMKQYPEYIFMSSQPQLYKYVKEEAPELYEEIKKAVKAGRWEVEGAMWLEADCNLSSGESLVRQIIHGKHFMKKEFDVDSKILWLPDVFGYSIALPQILKKSGVDKFVTSKISWNETNKMPYDAFLWQGLDGTEIFTYFLTARDHTPEGVNDNGTTYVGYIRPSQVLGTWERFQHKEYNNDTIITFGYGDGGGGPTRDMLEQQRRLAAGLPGFPATRIEKAGDMLARVEKSFTENCELLKRTPRWVGELYLEYHRGTYTSIAKNKKNNRKSELLYQETEKAAATDLVLLGGEYPAEDFYNAWEIILLNQFHDIIPGSSIFEVYEDCDKQYAAIRAAGEAIKEAKLRALAAETGKAGIFVYNPNSFAASATVKVGGESRFVADVPAMGWKIVADEKTVGKTTVEGNVAENQFFRMTMDENGEITLYDKKNKRQVFAKGETGNKLEAFEDFPRAYDDWEISQYYKQKMWNVRDVVSVTPIFDGARAGFEVVKTFSNSKITQKLWLYDDIAKVDVENTLDWQDHHVILKAAFPTSVHASVATYDVQFGNVERPTHENNSWDEAKFEVCAHKWADISDAGYGLSILNDCKYGYNAEGNVLKLTMLKCGTYPNPEADQGIHEFTYTIYPHAGAWRQGDTVKEAYLLNEPMTAFPVEAGSGKLADDYSFLACDADHVVVETVKKAYEDDSVIFRAYEYENRNADVTFTPGFEVKKAYLCDMMENELSEIPVVDGKITLPVGNYEIVTVKLVK
ncbi:MAG: alpha-mannosidase [Ruminococcaceae bacterium]|nr:alpha-mannosidase [Oscillospiraceae bacterium]